MNLAEETGGNTEDSCGKVIPPGDVCEVEVCWQDHLEEGFPNTRHPKS